VNGIVEIADNADDFSKAIIAAMNYKNNADWQAKVQDQLNGNSWDLTFMKMKELIYKELK
jgi:hypothetical protein